MTSAGTSTRLRSLSRHVVLFESLREKQLLLLPWLDSETVPASLFVFGIVPTGLVYPQVGFREVALEGNRQIVAVVIDANAALFKGDPIRPVLAVLDRHQATMEVDK